jgi:hypothetical protein
MTDSELDTVYTVLCTTMTKLGESNASLFLGRLTLLCLTTIDDADKAIALINEAEFDAKAAG